MNFLEEFKKILEAFYSRDNSETNKKINNLTINM